MSIHPLRRVKEDVVRWVAQKPKSWFRKLAVGSMVFAILPLPLLAPSIAPTKTESNAPWKTELTLAEASPTLLRPSTPDVKIEKIQSRYDEDQAKQAAAAAKKARAVAKAPAQAPSASANCGDMSDDQKLAYAQKAAQAYGIPTSLLTAVWKTESGMASCTSVSSSAGARGPLQFMSGTWRSYGVDGTGDGVANINDARDALFGAAKLLAANGANQGNYRQAALSYNHAGWYANRVLALAGL